MTVVRDARITKRANQDCIERSKQIVATGWNGFTRGEVVIGAPRQVMHLHTSERLQHMHRLRGDLGPDAVPSDDCDAMRHDGY